MTSAGSSVVFLTGAAGGIGVALTEALLAAGHRVAAVDRDAKALDRLSARHAETRDRLHPILADLAEANGCAAAVATARAFWRNRSSHQQCRHRHEQCPARCRSARSRY